MGILVIINVKTFTNLSIFEDYSLENFHAHMNF